MKKILALITVFMIMFCNTAYSAQVTLSWNPNSESDLAGYKVYYGNPSRSYSTTIDVGNVTSYIVTGLIEGDTYFFAATAYDFSGNESGYSNEVSYTVPDIAPAPPTGLILSGVNTLTWEGGGSEFVVRRNSSIYKIVNANTVTISGRHKQRYYFEIQSVYGISQRIYIKFYGWKGREV